MLKRFFTQIASFNPFNLFIKVLYLGGTYKIERHGNCFDIPLQKAFIPPVNNGIVLIPLGVKIQLPKYYRGILAFRSSTPKNYKILIPHGYGEIEWNYSGEWLGGVYTTPQTTYAEEGARLFQFYIEPVWDAPWYVHIRHIFARFKLIEVDKISTNRGGLGHTGK